MRMILKKTGKKPAKYLYGEPEKIAPIETTEKPITAKQPKEKGVFVLSASDLIQSLKKEKVKPEILQLAIKVIEQWKENEALNPDDIIKYKNYAVSLKPIE